MAKVKPATSAVASSESAASEATSAATIIAQVTASPGTMIMAARRRRGLSQRALAGRLCAAAGMATVSRHEISRWERGTRLPSAYWLGPLAALLCIDPADFDRA
ncbi:MAG TPA: helix-turn-helix transcriptional regulator, partial [Micromonosporaceae bacterium]